MSGRARPKKSNLPCWISLWVCGGVVGGQSVGQSVGRSCVRGKAKERVRPSAPASAYTPPPTPIIPKPHALDHLEVRVKDAAEPGQVVHGQRPPLEADAALLRSRLLRRRRLALELLLHAVEQRRRAPVLLLLLLLPLRGLGQGARQEQRQEQGGRPSHAAVMMTIGRSGG